MDDFLGTQAPLHRIADAGEALRAFERAAPALVPLKRPEPACIDWRITESLLGTSLPPDFKLLTEWYPHLIVGGTLYAGSPHPGTEQALVDATLEEPQIVQEWCEDADLECRAVVERSGCRGRLHRPGRGEPAA
ncbi:hypothetical protein [Streptacidiphilus sp. EB129]|uniref:hypothetical protein n=1 Tax=Streptacidiphilus sp. EB129 TaxID=3156262 RepID=UPI003518CCA2